MPKEIDNTELAFPLPGEGLKMGSSLEGPPPGLVGTPPTSNLTSWNTIVSGSQSNSSKLTVLKPAEQPEPTLGNRQQQQQHGSEPVDIPHQKQPIFGGQQKQNNKQKPTATVKPLKPLDGFTTVQNNRQTSNQQQSVPTPPAPTPPPAVVVTTPINVPSNASTGSRVSELDDFSADIPSAPSISSVLNMNPQEYPLATATVAPKSSGAKKKKKKGKEQVEHGAEVVILLLFSC